MIRRRSFVKLCAATLASLHARLDALAQQPTTLHHYRRVRLMADADRPLSLADLRVGENYVFNYPYICTPCFLLDLGEAAPPGPMLQTQAGQRYRWQGGVGPGRSVVGFSAICAHRMTHPDPQVSFINYRPQPVRFRDSEQEVTRRAQVIYCCSEKSVYDATQGARVLGGPAPQPLAAVLLEYDEASDGLDAVGIYGGEMFPRFFEKFSFRLALEYRTEDVQREVDGSAVVRPLSEYTRNQVLCGAT